jgi:hypothetical protein
METDDLLEVFGGRDNLRLMCGAKRFRVTGGGCRVSFWVGDDIVRLQKGGIYYTIQVQVRKTSENKWRYCTLWPSVIRDMFEQCTGYALSF